MAAISDRIRGLCYKYRNETQYCEKNLTISTPGNFISSGFLGSQKQLCLLSLESMVLEGPACLAARKIELAATRCISLGLQIGSAPLCIYAPKELILVGKAISIGSIEFLTEPELIAIDCNRITFYLQNKKDFELVELLKTGIFRTETEIEVIGPPEII